MVTSPFDSIYWGHVDNFSLWFGPGNDHYTQVLSTFGSMGVSPRAREYHALITDIYVIIMC